MPSGLQYQIRISCWAAETWVLHNIFSGMSNTHPWTRSKHASVQTLSKHPTSFASFATMARLKSQRCFWSFEAARACCKNTNQIQSTNPRNQELHSAWRSVAPSVAGQYAGLTTPCAKMVFSMNIKSLEPAQTKWSKCIILKVKALDATPRCTKAKVTASPISCDMLWFFHGNSF